jgi:hypothetical protein
VIQQRGRNCNGEQVLFQTLSVPGKPTFYRVMIWRHAGQTEFGPQRFTKEEGERDVQYHLTATQSGSLFSQIYNTLTDPSFPVKHDA